jgi:hypothetical protein
MRLAEKVEELIRTRAKDEENKNNIFEYENAIKQFNQMIDAGLTEPRGYQLRTIEQGFVQTSSYNTSSK